MLLENKVAVVPGTTHVERMMQTEQLASTIISFLDAPVPTGGRTGT